MKKEQERKAAERRRIIEERCGKPKLIDDANEGRFLLFFANYLLSTHFKILVISLASSLNCICHLENFCLPIKKPKKLLEKLDHCFSQRLLYLSWQSYDFSKLCKHQCHVTFNPTQQQRLSWMSEISHRVVNFAYWFTLDFSKKFLHVKSHKLFYFIFTFREEEWQRCKSINQKLQLAKLKNNANHHH